jgi:CRP-like cAMP-binding protein
MDRQTRAASAIRQSETAAVALRLQSVAACSTGLLQRVASLGSRVETHTIKAVLQTEDTAVRRPRYLVAGWACRYRYLADGRRQLFDLVLPGDGVGVCLRPHPIAKASTAALTPVRLVDAGPLLQPEALDACRELVPALQALADDDERRLLDQVMRLGRLTALERIAHLLVDLHTRLDVIGHAEGDSFAFPLTQETLADIIGLSVVHVNRTLQELRRQGLVQVERGSARLLDRPALTSIAQRAPA